MTVAVRVLGPLQVVINGVDVTPRAPKERALLAMLVLNHGRVVSADRLIEELWPTLAVDRGRRVLQVRVTALRKLLREANAPLTVEFVGGGYVLGVAPEDIDEQQFFTLVERARGLSEAGDPSGASAIFLEALALWRGDALADVQGCVSLEAEAARLGEARLGAIEDRIDADLAAGRHRRVVSELDALVAVHPLRERLWGQRVLALYRCARQAEALRACASIRRRLVDEIGVAPGPLLQALETAVLEQRRELEWSSLVDRRKPTLSRPPVNVTTDAIQDFVTGAAPNREISRVLTTVVFIDGVDDERKARELVARFRGTTVRRTEEGILATFDGPARAIRCASTVVSDLHSAGPQARAGLHSGECESAREDIRGVAVEIARGVVDLAKPGEVLVSQTVRDLVTGSAITFDGRGCHALEAIPGKWRIYAVATTE